MVFVPKLLEDVNIDFHQWCGGQGPSATLHTASFEVAPCSMSKLALAFGIITGRVPSVAACWLLHFCCINTAAILPCPLPAKAQVAC